MVLWKITVSLILCLGLLLVLVIPVSAATDKECLLEYDHIDTVTANLSIDRFWGVASCDGMVTTTGTLPVHVEVSLQQYTSNGWKILQTWTNTGECVVEASGSYAIAKGYEYRTFTTGLVYDENGNFIDYGDASYGFAYE